MADAKPAGKPKGKKGKAAPPKSEWPLISVAEHPRARRSIRRSKAWAALIAFVLVGYLSHRAGVEPFEVGIRALVAGVAAYVVVWAASVAVWQRLVLYEARTEAERRRDARAARIAAIQQAHEADSGGDGTAVA
jgi:type VI protein secretion system component VasK